MNREALREAARWRLAGLLLERPRAGWHEELVQLATEVGDDELTAAAATAGLASEGAFLAVLGPGGFASPREAAYCGLRDPGWLLADIGRYYEAFAYHPRAEDPADHVAVEVGFVGYLLLKEALASASGDTDAAEVTADARRAFIAEHLAPLVTSLAERVEPFGDHLAAVTSWLRTRLPAVRPAVPVDEDPLVEGCGGCLAAGNDEG
jgi:hypothetical protein